MEAEKREHADTPNFRWNHFLANLDLLIVKAGYAENIRKWSFKQDLTVNVFYRLYLAVSGSFRLQYLSGECVVEPGYLYLIPCDMLLKYIGITPCTHHWIHFVSNQMKTIPFLKTPLRIQINEIEPVREKMRMIMMYMKRCSDFESAVFIKNSLTELLIPFLKKLPENLQGENSLTDFNIILNYIDQNLHRNFKISELGSITNLRRAEISAAFRRIYGLPLKQYVSMRRLNRAKHLLLETNIPIKEIARQCSYQDDFFFNKIFKKYMGVPPAHYRKKSVY